MNLQKEYLISVIMPYYNSEKYIFESVNSILNQSYKNFELILLNDGSTDNSKNIVDSFLDNRISNLANKNNIGIAASMNKLIELASGKFIAFMDSDDISHTDRLKIQLKFIIENNLDICGSGSQTFGKRKTIIPVLEKNRDLNMIMIFGNPIINSSTLSKSSVLKKFVLNENMISFDFDLYSRIIQNNYKIGNINIPLIKSRIHSNQDSSINFKRGINDSYNISKRHYENYNINIKNKIYLEKINFGYSNNIKFEDYKNFVLFLNEFIIKNNYNFEILRLVNVTLLQKIELSINQYFRLIKIYKKIHLKIDFKHKIVLLINAFFKIKNNNLIYKILKLIYYFFLYFKR